MNIPGKLREDLKRIYGANDPLNYIEDVKVEPRCVTGAEENSLIVKLRVPTRMERYVASTDFGLTMPVDMVDALRYSINAMGQWDIPGVTRPISEQSVEVKKHKPMPVTLPMPKKIIYSGPKTVAIWPDGSKTMVSLMEGQEHDEYGAFCAAVVKKMFGATHKAKKFLDTIKSYKASNPRKPKENPEEVMTVEVHTLGSEEVREVPVKPWETTQTMPMPGTADPNWGQKHWAPETIEEEEHNG